MTRRSVFEQAADAGVEVRAVAPYAFRGSGLSNVAYRGARYTGTVGAGDLAAVLLESLAGAPRTLVYGYTAELDLTGHVRGVDSASWRAQLALVDRLVEQVVDGLPDDAALLVTADHGMLDVPAETALEGQRERRRALGPAAFAAHWRKWRRLRDDLPTGLAGEGWASVRLLDRSGANRLRRVEIPTR